MTTHNVYNGQSANGLVMSAGDQWNILYGGVVSNATVLGEEIIYAGGINVAGDVGSSSGTTLYDGVVYISSGGVDEGATVLAGNVYVASGATVETLTVSGAGAEVHLASGASLQGATFLGGEEAFSDATVSGLQLSGGGLALVELQGSSDASGAVVSSGGTLDVESGAIAVGAAVFSGAVVNDETGGAVSSSTVYNGGSLNLIGGTLNGDVLSSGATLDLDSIEVSGGQQLFLGVASAATADEGAILSSGAAAAISSGSSTVDSGAVQIDGMGSLVKYSDIDGTEIVLSGGVSSDSHNDGTLIISSGGSAYGDFSDVSTVVYGGAIVSHCSIFGAETIIAGYTLSGVNVNAGTALAPGLSSLTVSQGASVVHAAVGHSGVLDLESGGSSLSATVTSGGLETVAAGGSSLSTTVSSGGVETLASGGTAQNDLVLSGGLETIASGGAAQNVSVQSGGVLVDNGTLTYAGSATVNLAGTVSGSGQLVDDGSGTLEIGVANTFAGALVMSGGTVILERTGGVGKASIDFETTSATATLDLKTGLAPASGATFSSPLVDFNSSAKRLDLTNTACVSGATATVSGSTLVVKDGTYTASFTLSGAVATAYTVLSDAGTGTLIEAATSQAAVKKAKTAPPVHVDPLSLIAASAAMAPAAGPLSTVAATDRQSVAMIMGGSLLSTERQAAHLR